MDKKATNAWKLTPMKIKTHEILTPPKINTHGVACVDETLYVSILF